MVYMTVYTRLAHFGSQKIQGHFNDTWSPCLQ